MSNSCPRCKSAAPPSAKFCPQCGWDLGRSVVVGSMGAKHYAAVVLVAAGLLGSAWAMQANKAGNKPSIAYQPAPQDSQESDTVFEADPELNKLREAARAEPEKIDVQRQFGDALMTALSKSPEAPTALIFEAMDVFSGILKSEPKDPQALIAMADISFNQKVFDKAVAYFQRYLEINPEDLGARSRYASALAFTGKPEQAVQELKDVLLLEPEDFHALAYLSITYAQMGDKAHAREAGAKALKNSPSKEAKERFQQFLNALGKDELTGLPQAQNVRGNMPSTTVPMTAPQPFKGIAEYISKNPVAGPKYVRFETRGSDSIVIFLKDFPMSAMPPFAKQKFFGGIQAEAQHLGLKDLKHVIFLDSDSAALLDQLEIQAQ